MRRRLQCDVQRLVDQLQIRTKRTGHRLWAKCPNPEHQERTPSWFIWDDPTKGWHGHHKCYGCGFSGRPARLVETILGINWQDAVEWLVRHAAGQMPELPTSIEVEIAEAIKPIELPAEVSFDAFDKWPSPPKRYLEERNIGREQITRWGIGYAVSGELAGRIIIPVRTHCGVLAGYTGRSFSLSNRLRYKNATAADGAHLGVLHGEQFWTRDRAMIVVTEGTFDALAIERIAPGVTVGAIWGSQFLPAHAAKLARFGLVIVATDPDNAGDDAYDAIAGTLRRHTTVKRLHIPEGQDAATMSPGTLLEAYKEALLG